MHVIPGVSRVFCFIAMAKTIAIQGGYGAFHELAAQKYFEGEEIEIIPRETFSDLLYLEAIHAVPQYPGNSLTKCPVLSSKRDICGFLPSLCQCVGAEREGLPNPLGSIPDQQSARGAVSIQVG